VTRRKLGVVHFKAEDRDARRLVEECLGSVGRLRILHVLASGKEPTQTKYGLGKATGLKPVDVRKNLKVLVEAGWVKEYDYGPATYAVNLDDPRVKAVVGFFKEIGYL
jgi:hypothetical protein